MSAPNAPSRSFLCLRHGATDWNLEGRFQGLTDNPLNEDGIAQAHAAAQRLQRIPFDYIVSSPLIRASRTADIIAALSSKPLAIDDGIIECDFGSLEGRSVRATMNERGLKTVEDLISILPEDGEPWPLVSERSLACVSKWLDRHPQATILFVCHDAVMQSMSDVLCRRWFENRHGAPFRFERSGETWTLEEA